MPNFQQDTLFKKPQKHIPKFSFNQKTVDAFPDMIQRSVPGYSTIISECGFIAREIVQSDTNIYDLGCSLGESTISVLNLNQSTNLKIYAVDNSKSMITTLSERLSPSNKRKVVLVNDDVMNCPIHNASMVILNFTLQFIPLHKREKLLENIFDGLNPGGCLLLSEKIKLPNKINNDLFIDLHHQFKRWRGYSDLEISQKRDSIEDVLIPESEEMHLQRMRSRGFVSISKWFQYLNFCSFTAIKPFKN